MRWPRFVLPVVPMLLAFEMGCVGTRAAQRNSDAKHAINPGSPGSSDRGTRAAQGSSDAKHVSSRVSIDGGTTMEAKCGRDGFVWPDRAVAAISLTYDDSLPSQLDHAVPVLDAKSLRATFFLSETWWSFNTDKPRWSALVGKGYELASHSTTHPCQKQLPGLTLDQLQADLDRNIQTVRALGMTGPLTFAYPCGLSDVGTPSTSYIPAVASRFLAARGTIGVVADPMSVDLNKVPAMFAAPIGSDHPGTAEDLVNMAKQAEARKGWLVFGFHGVGEKGEYLDIPQASHDALCDYLAANSARLWVAPFGTVAAYVKRCR